MAAVQPTIEAFPHIRAQWSSPPCAYSKVVLSEQLREENVEDGEVWTIHHIASEFSSEEFFGNGNAIFEVFSPRVDMSEGVQGRLRVCCTGAGRNVEYFLHLYGFRGHAEYSVTAFRFRRGPPERVHAGLSSWNKDQSKGCRSSFKQAEVAEEGWLTPNSKIRVLLTVHLRSITGPVAPVESTPLTSLRSGARR